MPKMGLVLQGGGALGAYEYGAVTRLVERGWQPVAVTGVSIGAISAAAIAGARDGDVRASLKRLWDAITLPTVPFLPPDRQETLSAFGNPHFWRSRSDFFNIQQWTGLCDVSPMHETLQSIVDFKRLNDPAQTRLSVTATDIATGGQVSFSNYVARRGTAARVIPSVHSITLTPEHILASGSLPPGFPPTVIGDRAYWDGGLFDNTPIGALLDLLEEEEIDTLPIYVVDLFPNGSAVPNNLVEVQGRMMEISYENRFWAEYAGPAGSLPAFTGMLEAIDRELPEGSPVRDLEPYRRLQRLRALKNLKLIQAAHAPMTGGMDFSAYGVERRFKTGYAAVDQLLDGGASGQA